jgi:hypothetical protein
VRGRAEDEEENEVGERDDSCQEPCARSEYEDREAR